MAPTAIPLATYRLQLHAGFTFRDALALAPYLEALGISHVYASPVLAARPGSSHGYDVVDHERIAPELGGEDGFTAFADALARHGLGLVLDVVPNHMCIATTENRWWNDVLENGQSSPYARCFDIDWHPPKQDLAGKVLLPVLGDQYGRVLEAGEIAVELAAGAFVVRHYDSAFPVAPGSIPAILAPAVAPVRARLGDDHPQLLELESIITAARNLPRQFETDPARVRERQREKEIIKRRLATLVDTSPAVREELAASLAALNGRRGEPHSFDRLDALLDEQAYRLAHWGVAAEEINYRRFFDINDLAAIRIEEPAVLEAVHAKAFALLRAGKIDGLRIDHVDGLRDPERYLADLGAAAFGDPARRPYLVVEKILTGDEELPRWPIDGTTGYELLHAVGGVLVDGGAARDFERAFARMGGREAVRFDDLLYECKRLILRTALSSELHVLVSRLDRLSERHRRTRDFTRNTLHHALGEVIACFPVYRTYIRDGLREVSAADRRHVQTALAAAKRRNRALSASIFDFIGDVLLLRDPEDAPPEEIADRRELVMRVQQLTGPVMAKGLEDTAFYRYFPLASLCEVGGRPNAFGVPVERFHTFCAARRAAWPHALSATATHDTKHGEDLRARLAVLSELPRDWQAAVRRWRRMVRRLRAPVEDQLAPDAEEEYLFFQTVLGAWPVQRMTRAAHATFVDRIAAYMQKALREAKVHASWINPNEAYASAVERFVRAALADEPGNAFLADLTAFAARVTPAGLLGALAQVVMKVAAPGVPDFYQGTEVWDFSLVDPDNRRPVDYERLQALLARTGAVETDGGAAGASAEATSRLGALLARAEDGAVKMHVVRAALALRRRRRALFEQGDYVPLAATGPLSNHVVAFARAEARGPTSVIAIVGRFLTQIPGALPAAGGALGAWREAAWNDATIPLPPAVAPAGATLTDVLSGRAVTVGDDRRLPLADAFAIMPLALLET